MNERKVPRSQFYQNLYNELSVAPELLDSFQTGDNIFRRLNPHSYNEAIMDLEEQLRIEFWRLIEENLTDKQQKVVKLLSSGATQMDVAKIMGCNQSSIAKSISGNTEYSEKGTIKVYGGIKRKLKAALDKDSKIKEILDRIADLRDDTWVKE